MSRHGFVLIAHNQLRPLSFKLQPVCLANALISGRDIEVMSRHHLFSVPLVLMSRPQSHVATLFLGCDHFAVCMTTSCCDFEFLVAIVLVVFLPSYVSILCRDLMVMSRPLFLPISFLQVATSVLRCN